MNAQTLLVLSLLDVIGIPVCALLFIWRWQFDARSVWILFPVWLVASFLLHRDTPKTLGWRADNLWQATKWALAAFVIFAAALIATGLILGQPRHLPPNLQSLNRLWTYFAFCLLQQVAINSLLNNRLLWLFHREWLAALVTGVIFAACHWPNPVLVPLTLIGGTAMAWLFARHRNVLPLAVMQAVLGSIAWWSFPVAWHHNLRVGPAYSLPWK
ncbi:MAG TPA: CPBP family glutamic-type intramembrane protease [Candidatus Acidoferrales bacterium]|nr:CPBP family glutamic-type intramembrane protease [Candidatus Acidoferrales bacterium]